MVVLWQVYKSNGRGGKMINIILGVSITLNVICFVVAYFYIKYKVLGINKLKKEMQSKFVNEDDLDVMLDSL